MEIHPGGLLDSPESGRWFTALSIADRAELYDRGALRQYRTGATIFHEGDISDFVLLVVAGRIKVCSLTRDGREVVLAVATPGDLMGDLSAIDGSPRSATAMALDPVEARVVAAEEFRGFLMARSSRAMSLLVSICTRLREADRRRIEFVALDSVGRVANLLVELAERFGRAQSDGIHIDLPLSQDELAGWTGCSREAVGKALHVLRRQGWVRTGRRTLTVTDVDALRARAT